MWDLARNGVLSATVMLSHGYYLNKQQGTPFIPMFIIPGKYWKKTSFHWSYNKKGKRGFVLQPQIDPYFL